MCGRFVVGTLWAEVLFIADCCWVQKRRNSKAVHFVHCSALWNVVGGRSATDRTEDNKSRLTTNQPSNDDQRSKYWRLAHMREAKQ
eukprot:4358030-Amphidinium_carterae.1